MCERIRSARYACSCPGSPIPRRVRRADLTPLPLSPLGGAGSATCWERGQGGARNDQGQLRLDVFPSRPDDLWAMSANLELVTVDLWDTHFGHTQRSLVQKKPKLYGCYF
jgi:hypothetical protein